MLFQQYHSSQIDEVWKFDDSMIDLHRSCQIPLNYQCKWLSAFPAHLLQLFNVCDQCVSFPDFPSIQDITEKYTWQDFWTNVMQSRQVVNRSSGDILPLLQMEKPGLLNGFPNRLSCGDFPSNKRRKFSEYRSFSVLPADILDSNMAL